MLPAEYAKQDIARIRAAALSDIATFRRAATVCMLSARRHFWDVGAVTLAAERGDYGAVGAHQQRGIAWLAEHGTLLRDALIAFRDNPPAALYCATRVPALGLAKGGFLCQMMGIDVGCLDTHNVDRYALPRSSVCLRKGLRDITQMRAINAYCELCRSLGGSAALWGSWCEYLASLYPEEYTSGRYVSDLHVQYVEGVPF